MAVAAALVDICRARTPSVPDAPGFADEFVRAARYHRIAPLAYTVLRPTHPVIAALVRRDRDAAFTHHLRVLAALGEIERVLGDLAWLAFKGPVLSELAHPQPGLRSYKDLDILVDPLDLCEVYSRLSEVGWNVVDSNEALARPELSGEIRIASSRRILVDLHWSMVVNRPGRERHPVPTPRLLKRRRRMVVGLAPMWILDPVDSMLHVCLHAAMSGATRLLHLLDADQLARQIHDWEPVVSRAGRWQSSAQTAAVLGRTRRLLETPLPGDLYSQLGVPPGVEAFLGAVDRIWPTQTLQQDESFLRLATRAVRQTTCGTALAVMRSGALGVVNRLRPKPPPRARLPADPGMIARYLSAVEASVVADRSRPE